MRLQQGFATGEMGLRVSSRGSNLAPLMSALPPKADIAGASTGAQARRISMDHRIKFGGDESETVAWHSSAQRGAARNGSSLRANGPGPKWPAR
jgi:hypothetical protein